MRFSTSLLRRDVPPCHSPLWLVVLFVPSLDHFRNFIRLGWSDANALRGKERHWWTCLSEVIVF